MTSAFDTSAASASSYFQPLNPEHVQFLVSLQQTLQLYYDIEPPYCISEFACRSAQTETGSANCKGTTPEMLVYREDGTNLDVKGVSHFLYMIFNAHHDRQVSFLDLELQAEIDKFAFAVLDTDYAEQADALLERLFCDISYRSDLSSELKQRYEQANDLAFKYCRWLNSNFDLRVDNKALKAEIEKVYRLNGNAKIKHINIISEQLGLTGS